MVPEVISGRQTLMFAIIVGLTFGKPLGLLGASAFRGGRSVGIARHAHPNEPQHEY
jgi:Na+/H+ antiporter NhaA